jgi:impB/mucB/samB family
MAQMPMYLASTRPRRLHRLVQGWLEACACAALSSGTRHTAACPRGFVRRAAPCLRPRRPLRRMQVEEARNPALRGRPLGVTQKYLIVTCNYAARARGVTKLMGIADAQARCPELALVSGEDLTPYRAASRAIWAQLERFGTVQRGGLDEAYLDATAEVRVPVPSGAMCDTARTQRGGLDEVHVEVTAEVHTTQVHTMSV